MQRDESFDALRGIAIIAVVAIHASSSGLDLNNVTSSLNFDLTLLLRQLYNFAVPSFLFISGYFLSRYEFNSINDVVNFFTKRLSRILIPFLFWSLVFLCYKIYKGADINLSDFIIRVITGRAAAPFYFIFLLLQLYTLTPVFYQINRLRYGPTLILCSNIFAMTIIYYIQIYHSEIDGFYWYSAPFISWVIFYELGLITGCNEHVARKLRIGITGIKTAVIVVLMALSISIIEGLAIINHTGNLDFATTAVKFSSFIYSLACLWLFLIIRHLNIAWSMLLIKIGNVSFGIFLIHSIILGKVSSFLETFDIFNHNQFSGQFVAILTTLIICYSVITLSRAALPDRFNSRILGF